MSIISDSEIAEAVGRRVLQWNGAEFLEIIYMLEEGGCLKLLRSFAQMHEDSQNSIIEFMELVSGLENPELRVDRSGLHIEAE